MNRLYKGIAAAFFITMRLGAASPLPAADWPSFRGPDGHGVISVEDAKKLPTDFDGPTGKLIRWKTRLELGGESSPIVAGNRVFVSGGDASKRILYCFDADSGKLLWREKVDAGGKNPGDPDAAPLAAGPAAPTPTTDGRHVVALFGNGDIAGFDLEGKKLWSRNLGVPESGFGFASSPVAHGERVIVQFDHGTDASDVESSLYCIDIATGKTAWQTKRPLHASWTTPIIIKSGDKTQIITVGDPLVIGYEFQSGKELWRAECMGNHCTPSATAPHGIVYTALARCAMTAIKTDGRGNVTKTHIRWKNENDPCPEVPSPVTNGKQVFLVYDGGTVAGHDAATGKQLWEIDRRKELRETEFRSSPTLVGDQIWVFDRSGVLHRLTADAKGKVLGTAKLGEKTDAQPAYAGNRIYVRGRTNLYCIGAK
jgi:outer membrane protein assembly factor BamB